MSKAAFIGLGVMGYPMAGHLAAHGHDVAVWNRTAAKSAAWAKVHAGRAAASIADAAAGRDLVFVCVGADVDVRAVAEPALEAMDKGAVLVDHTTASPGLARELAEAATGRGLGFVDAPVSGGQAGAEKGQLTVMCGGRAEDVAKAEPVMRAYAKAITRMGEAGTGQLTKAVNQLAIAGLLQGLAEAVHFAKRAGLDVELVLEAIGKGAAQSWQMDNRMATMAKGEFEFGFAVDWMRKDLAIALEEARRTGARLPVAALVDQFYAEVQAMGGSRWDTSSLAARLERSKKTS
jgi:3-hydroxyisobutyrate dehydrogenase-like beta-hydroxyacid dehydrogenase